MEYYRKGNYNNSIRLQFTLGKNISKKEAYELTQRDNVFFIEQHDNQLYVYLEIPKFKSRKKDKEGRNFEMTEIANNILDSCDLFRRLQGNIFAVVYPVHASNEMLEKLNRQEVFTNFTKGNKK